MNYVHIIKYLKNEFCIQKATGLGGKWFRGEGDKVLGSTYKKALAAPQLWTGVTPGQVELSLSLSLSLSLFLNWSDAGHLGGARQGLRTRDMRQGYGRGMASEEWKEWNIKVGFSCWYVHHTFS